MLRRAAVVIAVGFLLVSTADAADAAIDLSNAEVLTPADAAPLVQTAATVLREEVAKRTGLDWRAPKVWPKSGAVIVVASGGAKDYQGHPAPGKLFTAGPEGYAVATMTEADGQTVVWIIGADPKGTLSGVGHFLRKLNWRDGSASLSKPLNVVTTPHSSIRGHQLGYRTTANSYDAWDAATYDQYIRELALFGANAIENIPFQDKDSEHMPISREEMNREMSRICDRYGMQYWVWTPATVDLDDAPARAALLEEHAKFYETCPKLDAVFFPGGDPGHNPPELVMPFLEDVAKQLAEKHPNAGVWMSLQGFDDAQVDYFFDWISEHQPDWFIGAVGGPSSPPLAEMRRRLPARYKLRDYPDITHTVRSQYPTAWIDPAFAFTSGREGSNPEPVYYATIHRLTAPFTDGFITYSDGMHDDVNKAIWSGLGWAPDADPREIVLDYCRLFFGADVAEEAADGVFALEQNWAGPLATNGGVAATLALWKSLDAKAPHLDKNWRWKLCLLKAHYDAYVRERLIAETQFENEANAALALAQKIGADAAIDRALAALNQADACCNDKLRSEVVALCDDLFKLIGYQTSVEKYGANDPQRGAVLDFLDHPLNNRWWLEDEFAKVRNMPSEADKVARLEVLRKWEHPGEGSFYDDIGNVAKSPHVIRGEAINTDPIMIRNPNPDYMWWDDGKSRVRPSWISKMDWPIGLRYEGVDPAAKYSVRTTGYGQCLLRVNGKRVEPTADGREIGDVKEFPIPPELYELGVMELTFDTPHEPGVNWREASRLCEVWLIRQADGAIKKRNAM